MDENHRTAELRRKLEKDPASRLFAQLAEELRKDGRHEEAIAVARGGLAKNPNYPSARLTLARALLDSGQPAEARPELESVVRSSPDNILAGRLLGEALAELGETALAIKQFERALVFVPGDKAITERLAELKAQSAAPAPPAPVAAPAHAPLNASGGLETRAVPPSPVAETAPSVPELMTLEMPEAPAPVDMASAPALDRDLASGTFSPGSLNVVDLQRHFEAAAAAENVTALPAPVGSSNDLEATIGTGDLPALTMPEDPDAVDATLNLRVSPMLEEAPPALPSTTEASAEPAMPEIADAFDDAAEMAPLEAPELPSIEMPDEAADPGGATLPLTSMTLADLYLQQGLKQEASAVLSQVVRDEPENAAAHSRLAQVSAEVAAEAPGPVTEAAPEFKVAETLPPRAAPAPPAAVMAAPPPPTVRTRAQVHERAIRTLKAFQSAVEREALQQKASERSAF
jgi:tetratricopeptide (TPR) repeat protein